MRKTFVRVTELEHVQPGRIVWKEHHPASNAHLLTGAGLVLQRVWKTSELRTSTVGLQLSWCLTYVLPLRGPKCFRSIERECWPRKTDPKSSPGGQLKDSRSNGAGVTISVKSCELILEIFPSYGSGFCPNKDIIFRQMTLCPLFSPDVSQLWTYQIHRNRKQSWTTDHHTVCSSFLCRFNTKNIFGFDWTSVKHD